MTDGLVVFVSWMAYLALAAGLVWVVLRRR